MRRLWWLVFLAFQPCSGAIPPELRELKDPLPAHLRENFRNVGDFLSKVEQLQPWGFLLHALLDLYWLEARRFPTSWREVCNQDWIPVRCDLLVNPLSGKKLLEQDRSELGSIWLENNGNNANQILVVFRFYDRPPELDGPKDIRLPVKASSLGNDPGFLTLWPHLTASQKKAYALAELVDAVLEATGGCARELGWSAYRERFPVIRAIRNPYTGEPAEPFGWWTKPLSLSELRKLAEEAAAGEFLVEWHSEDTATVDVVTEEGVLLEDALRELQRRRNAGERP